MIFFLLEPQVHESLSIFGSWTDFLIYTVCGGLVLQRISTNECGNSISILNFLFFIKEIRTIPEFHIQYLVQLLAAGDVAAIFQELVPPGFSSLSWLYALCHFGDHLTERFNDVGDAFYRLSWYQFPVNMQKDLIFVIAAAQKKVFLRGYAGTFCTREVYKKVCFSHSFTILNWLIFNK